MAMVVKNNMSAVRTLNTLNANTSALQKSLQKVSSGMKINSAQDDASGYAISERMRVRIRSLDQANQNTQNDASLMKTAEGAVGNTVEILRALKEKAINAANDSNTDEDRQTIQKEINQFIDQIDDNALVQFNGKYLIDGSKNNATVSSKTILLNQSLHVDTMEDDDLTDLRNRAGDSLGIQTSDKWQVSWVENGNITFASGTVGDKTLEDILNAAWKTGENDDGEAIHFAEVAATTANGRISSAKPAITSLGKLGGNGTPTDDMKAAIDASGKFTSGTASTVALSELGFYADEAENAFKYDPSGTTGLSADGETPYVDYDGTDYVIQGLKDGTEIFGVKVETKIPDVVASTVAIEDDSTGNDGSDFTKDLAKELVDSGLLDVDNPISDEDGINLPGTNSMKLSDLKITDADGNQISKYYLKDADGKTIDADDIIATRTRLFNRVSGTVTPATGDGNDKIEFSSVSGATLSSVTLYEYAAPASGGGTGFDDAWDKFGKAVYTPDKTAGIAVAASSEGVNSQLSGLTISILDQDGNVKKAANAALDQFKQYQRAENKTGDMSLNFHIGSEANVAIKVGMSDMRSEALGLKGSDGVRLDVYTKEHANSAINVIENALTKALDQQTTIGAIEARLEYTSTNLTTSSENVQAAESTIRDADMAKEMTNYTKSNVLLQAAQAMLAQANQNSSAVLSLLQ